MIKIIKHWFGIHNWKYHLDYYGTDFRECRVCAKHQKRKRLTGVGGIFDENWSNV